MFFDEHKWESIVEYWKTFLKEIKSLLSYFVEFQDDGIILPKKYPKDYAVGRLNWQLIIIITHDESIFLANDSLQKVWTLKGHRILWPKGRGKDIIISDFLLSWSRLNLFSFSPQHQKDLANSGILLRAAIYFEYCKMEKGYWTGEHLLDQIKSKVLPIGKALYWIWIIIHFWQCNKLCNLCQRCIISCSHE